MRKMIIRNNLSASAKLAKYLNIRYNTLYLIIIAALLQLLQSQYCHADCRFLLRKEVTNKYIALYLRQSGWRFRLNYSGRLKPSDSFTSPDSIILNCLYFNTKTGSPVGIIRQDSSTIADDGQHFGTAFVWDNNEWKLVSPAIIKQYDSGFQVGPTLLHDKQIIADCDAEGVNPSPYTRSLRMGIGRIDDGTTLILATRKGFTIREFANLMSHFDVSEAINLDGGTSAFMFVDGEQLISAKRLIPAALVVESTSQDNDYRQSEDNPQLYLTQPNHKKKASADDSQTKGEKIPLKKMAIFGLKAWQLVVSFVLALATSIAIAGIIHRFKRENNKPILIGICLVVTIILTFPYYYLDVGNKLHNQAFQSLGLPKAESYRQANDALNKSNETSNNIVPSKALPVSLFEIPENGANGRIVFREANENLEELRTRTNAKMIVSPSLFNTDTNIPIGNLICNGRIVARGTNNPPGVFWGITNNGICVNKSIGNYSIGASGPIFINNGEPIRHNEDLLRQGYTRYGGQLDKTNRIAIVGDRKGKVFVAMSNIDMRPAQFAETLINHYSIQMAIGLSGGPHLVLYKDGIWYSEPKESNLPYVFAF